MKAFRFSKFEQLFLFAAFMLAIGLLVGMGYLVTSLHTSEAPAKVADADLRFVIHPPAPAATQPSSPAKDQRSEVSLPPFHQAVLSTHPIDVIHAINAQQAGPSRSEAPPVSRASPMVISAPPITAPLPAPVIAPVVVPVIVPVVMPATQPARVIAVQPPAATVPATQPVRPTRVAIKPAPVITPTEPIALRVPAGRVVHMYCGEDNETACWCELKLDHSERDRLRTSLLGLADAHGLDVCEYDHAADRPAPPRIPVSWWRPDELIDVDVVSLTAAGASPNRKIWAAISQRTGRVFLFGYRAFEFSTP